MLSVLCLILVSVYLYRHHLYNKLDRQKLSHSSYYDVSFGGERKCSDEVVRILKDVGGYKKIVVNWHYCENGEPSCADVILLHETGIYVVEAKDYQGWISGEPEDEYWVQTLCGSQLTSYKNYFYNPLMKNSSCIRSLQKDLPDMKWLPFFPWPFSETNANWKMPDCRTIPLKLSWYASFPILYMEWSAAPESSLRPRLSMKSTTGCRCCLPRKQRRGNIPGLTKSRTFIIVKNNRRPAVIFWRGLRRI